MKRPLFSIGRDQRGAAMIEMAFIAPVIALMTVGVVDLSNGFGTKLRVEQAAQRSIEKVMQTTGVTTVEDTIAAEAVCQYNGTNSDGSCKTAPLTTADVTVTHRLECNNVVSSAADCNTGEKESRWVQVTVATDYTPMFPLHFTGIASNGKYHIQSIAGMRTQ